MKSATANQIAQPDYAGLVRLLPHLHNLADAAGAVTLEPHEADRIRALGFHAQPGTWSVPSLRLSSWRGIPSWSH